MKLRETAIISGGMLAQQVTVFLTGILTARLLGATGYGTLGVLKSLSGVLVIVTPLGLDLALLKHASFYREQPAELEAISRGLRLVVLFGNLLLLSMLIGFGGQALQHVYTDIDHFGMLCIITMLGVVFATDVQISGALYRVFNWVVLFSWIVNYSQPIVRITLIGLVLLANGGVLGVTWTNTAASAFAFVALSIADRKVRVRPARIPLPVLARKISRILSESLWMALSMLVYQAIRLVDILILAALTTPGVVGSYAAMSSVAQLIQIYPGAVSQTLGPSIALAYRNQDHTGIIAVLQDYLCKACLLGGWLFGGIAVFGMDLDLVFGAGFHFPPQLPALLATGWFVSATLAPFGYVLSMTGRHREEVIVLAAGAALLIALLLLLIPPLGATGAALAVAITFIGVNAARCAYVFRIIGDNPLSLSHLVAPACFLSVAVLCRAGGAFLSERSFLTLSAECIAYAAVSFIAFWFLLATSEQRQWIDRSILLRVERS